MTKLYHHTFRPWKADGDRRIVASEAAWKKPVKWAPFGYVGHSLVPYRDDSNGGGPMYQLCHAPPKMHDRPRVLVDVDVFEEWSGWPEDIRVRELPIGKDGERWLQRKSRAAPG